MTPTTAFLSSILALAPPDTPTERAPIDVSDIEVSASDGVLTLQAFDAGGEVSADVAIWMDDGVQQIDVTFPDGLYLFVSIDGDDVTTESNGAAEAHERMVALETTLAGVKDVDWVHVAGCAAGALVTANACANPIGWLAIGACAGAGIMTARECSIVLGDLAE